MKANDLLREGIDQGTEMQAFYLSGWSKRITILAFLLSTFFYYTSFFPSPAYGGETIKIGLLTPRQESGFKPGDAYLRGAEMAVAEANAREGKEGQQLLLVLRGEHHIQGKNPNWLRELIVEERLHFLMGEVRKEDIPQISRMVKQQRLPFLVFPTEFIEASSNGERPTGLFWISPSPEAFQRATVRTAAQFPKKRFFLLARNSSAGQGWAKYVWEELKRLKPDAQPVGELFFPEKVADYGPHIQTILSAKPEVCISYLGGMEWPRFARAAKRQGYFRQVIHFEVEGGGLESLVALKKDAPEGVWGVSAFPFWALGWKETREFVAKYKEKTGAYPGLDALSGYVSIYALLEAMKKSGSSDPDRVIGILEGLTFRTPVGQLAIRKGDHQALWPIWCGSIRFTPEYPFAVLGDLKAFGPDSFSP
jgi:branched-chain amino acid transport system substrate-binding protein